jgi:hypothetical protein
MASQDSKVAYLPTITPLEADQDYVVTIGGVDVHPLIETFTITETMDSPDTLIGEVVSIAAPYFRPTVGQSVFVTEGGVRIFGGSVTGVRERGFSGPNGGDIVVEIQASSFELNAARRAITASFSTVTPATIGAAFNDLVVNFYGALGVVLHPAQVAGPVIPAVSFERERGDTVNRQLAGSIGWLQSIDFFNQLRAWAPGDIAAPVNYDENVNPDLLTGDLTVERQLQNGYANRIVLSGEPQQTDDTDRWIGDGVTQLFHLSRQPINWWVVVLNETNLYETVGSDGAMWIIDPAAKTIRREDWKGPPPAGTIIDFRYVGIFDPHAAAEDAAEIAQYGLWEFADTISSLTGGSATDYAAQLLARKIASKDEIVTMDTRQVGFRPGQLMNVIAPSRGVAGDFLITQVETRYEADSKRLVRTMTLARSQANDHDWRRIYVQWAGGAIGDTGSGGGSTTFPPPIDPGAGSAIHGATHQPEGIDPIPHAAFVHIPNAWTAAQGFPKVRAGGIGQGSKLLHVGDGNDPVVNGQDGITVQMQNIAAQISLRYANATAPMEMGLIAFPSEGRIGTWTNHRLVFRANNAERLVLALDGINYFTGQVTVTGGAILANAGVVVATDQLYVNGFHVSVIGDVVLPQAGGGGGGDVYLNVANVFTQVNKFPVGGVALESQTAGNYVRLGALGFNTAERLLWFNVTDASRTLTLTGDPTIGGGGTWTTSGWNKAIELSQISVLKWKKATYAWAIGQSGDALYLGFAAGDDGSVGLSDYPVIFSTNASAYLQVQGGAVFKAAGVSTDPGDGIGAALRVGYSLSGDYGFIESISTGVAAKSLRINQSGGGTSIYGPLFLGQSYLYVGPFRVDVTANCTIPGAGGGATLPPNLAYNNLNNNWSAPQTFNAGISVNGGFTVAGVDWNTWLNQPVRSDSSPTFAGLHLSGSPNTPVSGSILLDGNLYSNFTITAQNGFSAFGSAGLTVTRVLGGVSCVFKGGILVG